MSTKQEEWNDMGLFDDVRSDKVESNTDVSNALAAKIETETTRTHPKKSSDLLLPRYWKYYYSAARAHIATNEGTRIEAPTNRDILCGQSRVCLSHPGNRAFLRILEDFAHKYDSASNKQEKMCMTKEVVSMVHNSGSRFLKLEDGMWEELSTVAARDKVSHALRTKKAAWKRQRQHLLQNGSASNDNDNDNDNDKDSDNNDDGSSHSHSIPPPSRKRSNIARNSIKIQRSRQTTSTPSSEAIVYTQGTDIAAFSDSELLALSNLVLGNGRLKFSVYGFSRGDETNPDTVDTVMLQVIGGTITYNATGIINAAGDAKALIEHHFGSLNSFVHLPQNELRL